MGGALVSNRRTKNLHTFGFPSQVSIRRLPRARSAICCPVGSFFVSKPGLSSAEEGEPGPVPEMRKTASWGGA
jgi:hypothetical protein